MTHLRRRFLSLVLLLVLVAAACSSQHVIIIVLDGVRYQESFGAQSQYIPHIWNDLRPQGTIFTNFRNNGRTITCPGHATILTGKWQDIPNDGSKRPPDPTIFEYYRHQTGKPPQSCYVVSGKKKLQMLTYGLDSKYGGKYGGAFVSNDEKVNIPTYRHLREVLVERHPSLVIVNFAETDARAHDGDWSGYLHAIHDADSVISDLWSFLQSDSVYRNTTNLFVTNDHGRHDDGHGGFKDHGDSCEGCRHIMLLAIGPGFTPGSIIDKPSSQVDIFPTVAAIMGLKVPPLEGKSLLSLQSKD